MKVSTPPISWHNRERISSADFQPVCYPSNENQRSVTRLATGGDDKHVVIWDISIGEERSIENKNECGKVEPVCLCDLSRHQNSVNIVRWSPNGQILASGDTDSVIFLWQFQDETSSSRPDIFGDMDDGPIGEGNSWAESWGVLKILRGHLQDVVGLAWSPCSTLLASCSTDATAIIFDVNKGTKMKILSDHKGWVNGVAWSRLDPFSDVKNGKGSLATLASDRCMRVYNASTKNYKNIARTHRCKLKVPITDKLKVEESKKSDEPPLKNDSIIDKKETPVVAPNVRLFHDDTFPSFYRRLDYSPDGELLVVPSGVLDIEGETSDSLHCTYIFSTSNYSKPVVYLPGKEFSVAARFSPIKYELRPVARVNGIKRSNHSNISPSDRTCEIDPEPELKPWEKYQTIFCLPYRMIYAVATQNSIMLHDTQQAEPFARISRLHYIGLNDLTWSSDGNTLVVSSTDGYCSIINFKPGELGQAYQPKEMLEQEDNLLNQGQDDKNEDSHVNSADAELNDSNAINGSDCQANKSLSVVSLSEKINEIPNDSNQLETPQNVSTKEEPMEIELNPLPIKLNEEVVSKDKCFNSEINSVPKSQSIQCISETSVQTTQYGNEIEEKSIEKAKKRVQLITLSSKKSV